MCGYSSCHVSIYTVKSVTAAAIYQPVCRGAVAAGPGIQLGATAMGGTHISLIFARCLCTCTGVVVLLLLLLL
jgi:hypothetical protein